jgi:hypothetical protein
VCVCVCVCVCVYMKIVQLNNFKIEWSKKKQKISTFIILKIIEPLFELKYVYAINFLYHSILYTFQCLLAFFSNEII